MRAGFTVGSVSIRECLDASAILATFTCHQPVRPAVKVARIAGASRHSRLETEPRFTVAGIDFIEVRLKQQGTANDNAVIRRIC